MSEVLAVIAARFVRSHHQMTLNKFVALLEQLPPTDTIIGLGSLNCYRGYDVDLAFEPSDTPRNVSELREHARWAMGTSFVGWNGWNGNTCWMDGDTPLWVAPYGEATGQRLITLTPLNPHYPLCAPED